MNATSEVSTFIQFDQLPDPAFKKIIQFILTQPKRVKVRLVSKQFYYQINHFLNLTITCSPKGAWWNWDSTEYIYKFKDVEKEIDMIAFCNNESRDLWPLIKTVSLRIRLKSDVINILNTLNGKTAEECDLTIEVLNSIPELVFDELILSNNTIDSLQNQFPNFCVTKISIARDATIEFIRFLVSDQFRLIDLCIGTEELNQLIEILNGDMFDSFSKSLRILQISHIPEISIIDQDNLMSLLVQKFPNLTDFDHRCNPLQCPKITLLSGWKYLTKLNIVIWISNDNNTDPLDYTRLHGTLVSLKELDLYVSREWKEMEHANQLVYSISQLDMPSLVRCNIKLWNIDLDLDCLMQLLTYEYNTILRSIINFEFTIPNLSNTDRIMYRNVLKQVIKQCTKLNEFSCKGSGQLIRMNNYKLLRSLPASITKIEWREQEESSFYKTIFNVSFNDYQRSMISINRDEMVRLVLAMNDLESKKFKLSLRGSNHYYLTDENEDQLREELDRIFYVVSHEQLKIELSIFDFVLEWSLTDGRKRELCIPF